ncbi:MAG: hypothetical protein D6694_01310 [Gammaproteobacteria bacterium]|nr:MAG: hypothetical protein D6694_01310 [Gammaproteobacteria bacterium]
MTSKDERTSLLEELIAIRRSLSGASQNGDVPLLDDVVTDVGQVENVAPILSDAIAVPPAETHHQAQESWQNFWVHLIAWTDTLGEKDQLLAQKVFHALQQQLANAWQSAYEQMYQQNPNNK